MDIKERLRLIESIHAKQRQRPAAPEESSVAPAPHAITGAERVNNSFGAFSCISKDFPPDYYHGAIRLARLLQKSPEHLALLARDTRFAISDFRKILFIDTETTGLSGGAGTCAFLVGLGYFAEEGFRVAQFFMNDFDEEAALIYQLNEFIGEFELLVSYNGKPFDAPILNSRNVYQGFKSPLPDILHLDLLFLVRRLWKHRLPDCTLGTAESLINFYRSNDIPGYLIPYLYAEYLRHKDARPLQPIFQHNRFDIISMVALLTRAIELLENPLRECGGCEDALAIGKLYEDTLRYQHSIELYQAFLNNSFDRLERRELWFRLAHNHKKLRQWQQAAAVWHACLENESFHPLPYIELAKHYEHREKDLAKALQLAEKALTELEILERLKPIDGWREYQQNLQVRKKRLTRKLCQ